MAEKQNDCVSFKEVQKSYPPGEALKVKYELQVDYKPASRDWVGLFQVGWTSSRDYYTFEWAPTPEDKKGIAKFAGRRLPPEDSHFYQFCYVSSSGRVRGASPPFQFTTASLCKHNVEDLELVEIKEDSIMVLQQKVSEEAEVQHQLSTAQESLGAVELKNEQLIYQLAQQQTGHQTVLAAKDAELADLQRKLEIKTESEQRLGEKLASQRAETDKLMAVKNDDDSKHALIISQLARKEEENSQQSTVILTQSEEIRELKGQLQIRDSRVDDLTQLATARGQEKEQIIAEIEAITSELIATKGQMAELLERNDQKTIEFEQLSLDFEEAKSITEQAVRKANELQQELNIATENISELMGQRDAGIVFERPQALPEPPTAPAAPLGTVDSTVYASLLEAFENVQMYYEDVKKENIDMQIKVDEMTARIQLCKDSYEDLAKEKRADDARIKELEEQLEDFTQGCGAAVTELSKRKEEIKQKEATINGLEETLAQVQFELQSLQDRHDTEVQRRVEQCDITKATLETKIEELSAAQHENAKLKKANDQLKAQLEGLKTTVKANDRSCPVCSTKFPLRMRQQDFESHVNGHFNK